jgi:hypothetical protein
MSKRLTRFVSDSFAQSLPSNSCTLLPFLYCTTTLQRGSHHQFRLFNLGQQQLRRHDYGSPASEEEQRQEASLEPQARREVQAIEVAKAPLPATTFSDSKSQPIPNDWESMQRSVRLSSKRRSDPLPGRYFEYESARPLEPTKVVYESTILQEPIKGLSPSGTTLTRRESGIFASIYKDVLQNIGELRSDTGLNTARKGRHMLENEDEFSEDDSLESIFSNAVCGRHKFLQASNPMPPGSVASEYAIAHDSSKKLHAQLAEDARPLDKEISTVAAERPQWDKSQMFGQAQSQDESKFHTNLAKAVLDTDVWRVFQNDVLSKMKNFMNLVIRHSRPASTEADVGEISGKSLGRRTLVSTAESYQKVLPWQQEPDIMRKLAVLRQNYAQQCVACLQVLRIQHPRSPYVLSILPKIKSLGAISYALAASTELYNELLFVRWVYYRDLHSCAELVNEMLDRSVPTDAKTRAVFTDAARTRMQARAFWRAENTLPELITAANAMNGESDIETSLSSSSKMITPVASAWWQLHGTREGWKKWEDVEERAVAEYRAEQQRRHEALARAKEDELEDEEDEYGAEESENVEEPDIEVVSMRSDGVTPLQNELKLTAAES